MNLLITVVQFDAYFDTVYNAGAITSETDSIKTKLIYTAQNFIVMSGYDLTSSTVITDKIIAGICETASYIYSYDAEIKKRIALQSMNVDNFKIDKLSEKYTEMANMLPFTIKMLLDDLKRYKAGFFIDVTRS